MRFPFSRGIIGSEDRLFAGPSQEGGGSRMQENRTKQHRRKMIAPILISAAVVLYYLFFFLVIVSFLESLVLKLLLGMIPAILGAVMIGVCIQRSELLGHE